MWLCGVTLPSAYDSLEKLQQTPTNLNVQEQAGLENGWKIDGWMLQQCGQLKSSTPKIFRSQIAKPLKRISFLFHLLYRVQSRLFSRIPLYPGAGCPASNLWQVKTK